MKLLPLHPRPNPSRYWVSNGPLASGALSLLEPPFLPILPIVEGNNKGRVPHASLAPAKTGDSSIFRRTERGGEGRLGLKEEADLFLSFSLLPSPVSPSRPPVPSHPSKL